jgi:hypothetical protein
LSIGFAQSQFSLDQYRQFLETNANLTRTDLLQKYPLPTYYKGFTDNSDIDGYLYLDSIKQKYSLTVDELALLERNRFVVSERLNKYSFGSAFYDVFYKDLPVMVTTDAILHALHRSYDEILIDLEQSYLKPHLQTILENLYHNYSFVQSKYSANQNLGLSLEDVDLYITMAYSLLLGGKLAPHLVSQATFDSVWTAVASEKYVKMPLFTESVRDLDFSQFTVRGHYEDQLLNLGDYFRAMIWLGRVDFMLTQAPGNPVSENDLLRMNIDAFLLNELIDTANVRTLLEESDKLTELFIGESDNLTPSEYKNLLEALNLTNAAQLLDSSNYENYCAALKTTIGAEQRILSDIFIMNPFSSEPDELPVSYRLLGQRFIIDSYVFSNVVYDRIIYNGNKIWRPLPDPLDAMFALGNSNAGPLLSAELDQYFYGSQLHALRYLVDAYDDEFWNKSLYNSWLNAIRKLNPATDRTGQPLFMQTAAWQQEKLNTQLASWAQLRHDNLLYAKQSYTGGVICSYPHSWIEPYPAFYRQIATFSRAAESYLSQTGIAVDRMISYFHNLDSIMTILGTLAEKELQGIAFNATETDFLKGMLFAQHMCGAPNFNGWYVDLFYDPLDAEESDYIIADVHTQPTDESGGIVGRVLHVATGEVNLGVFLANSPSLDFRPMAFVGPVMSYYEKITDNFDRLTDSRWADSVNNANIPSRPDWVNIYLADKSGQALSPGRELAAQVYSGIITDPAPDVATPQEFALLPNYPNPFNARTIINYELPKPSDVVLEIYNLSGQLIKRISEHSQSAGRYQVVWDAGDQPSGVYFCQMRAGKYARTIKLILLK